jgi:hypothetical protein
VRASTKASLRFDGNCCRARNDCIGYQSIHLALPAYVHASDGHVVAAPNSIEVKTK